MTIGTGPVVFVEPNALQLQACCLLVEVLKRVLAEDHCNLNVTQFVSEMGFRRGIAIAQNDALPPSFVLLHNRKEGSEKDMTDEQAAMLRHALIVYVGVSELGALALNFLVPDDSDGLNCDELMKELGWLLDSTGAIVVASVPANQAQRNVDDGDN